MNTIEITNKLNQALIDYLATTFDVSKDGGEIELAYEIRKSFEYPGALFKGPFLEMILPYITDLSIKQLVDQGIFSEKLLDLSCFGLAKPEPIPLDMPLYNHQVKAIKKLIEDYKSIVISAGTGSGKTECFTLPIVNDLLLDDTPGVRALLVYPLNALVNDQLDRLRILLAGTNILFGRFTGELKDNVIRDSNTLPNEVISRNEIRVEKKIPQILITNYAMLEYLLLRPEDSILFQSGGWKYLILDEAHTYTGAQGIEVAMLVRRLKERMKKKPGDMLCVATSATLVNDDARNAVDFARNLFGENVAADDIIFGEVNTEGFSSLPESNKNISPDIYIHPDFDNLIEEMRKAQPDLEKVALWMVQIGLLNEADLDHVDQFEEDMAGFLYSVLVTNQDIHRLRQWMIERSDPVTAIEAARFLFPSLDDLVSLQALYHLIELGALARPSSNKLPLLPAKYHLFARPPQGIWVCINPACPDRAENRQSDRKWSKVFSIPHETCDSCNATVYPLFLCRQCGEIFIATYKKNNAYYPAADSVVEDVQKQYFTWEEIEENIALSYADEEEDETEEFLRPKFLQEAVTLCLSCGSERALCKCQEAVWSIPLYNLKIEEKKRKGKNNIARRWIPVEALQECPRCGSSSKAGTEIVTPISLYGTAPLANLTYELYRLLPMSPEEKLRTYPGQGRKLLTFYDSRQGAARFAAFLQDVANKQNYRHIIPKAIASYKKDHGYLPSLKGLSDVCVKLALENKIIQNDPDMEEFWRKRTKSFSREEKALARKWIVAQILGEITTGSRQRQSLESLGLIGINYFEDDELPDFQTIGDQIGLHGRQTLILIGYLLDDLRYQKVITLPSNIERDDPVFGPHKGNPSIIRQGATHYGEIRWIGATTRQRRRKYIQTVLHNNGLDYSATLVEDVLTKLWDWIIEETDIFEGSTEKGYRLNTSRFFFDTVSTGFRCKKCQRFSYRGTSLPCPFPHCGGDIEPVDIFSEQQKNYYYQLFNENLIPIRVEEHTAQLDPKKGEQYQNDFKKGDINVLSCSTTFEMGIDLGDLQAVAMSNVPPTVANYRQRSGRAGRSTTGTAFILTWASGRPHDQAYYANPAEIINGQVAVPLIFLENEHILRRHINAILLSLFLRYRKKDIIVKKCAEFFDLNYQEDPQYNYLGEWVEAEKEKIADSLTRFGHMFDVFDIDSIDHRLEIFRSDLDRVDKERYQPVTKYYIEQIECLADKSKDTTISAAEYKKIENQLSYFRRLLDRMRNDYLINYLSNNGVLPSYSFPLHTVELLLPKEARGSENLRLERDLRQAIREYAPGSEIVADKRIWRSLTPIFWRDTVRDYAYRICDKCQHLEFEEVAGKPLPNYNSCPICAEPVESTQRIFVEPDGFLADKNSGKPAKQYVNIEPNLMRSAILPLKSLDEEQIGNIIHVAYEREGKLLYVNEGKFGNGFELSLEGFNFEETFTTKRKKASLGHSQTTDTLHIRFVGSESIKVPSPNDMSFWLSLMYAIIQAASHYLQIERRDIDGVLSPRKLEGEWVQTIVLFDNVPGGAGHVKNIRKNFREVLEDSIRVLNCVDCAPETSCHHCLRDYNNQHFYHDLKSKHALKFLEVVITDLRPLENEVDGASRVVSSNLSMWLLRKIENARLSLEIALEKIELGHPLGENYSWFDTLNSLLLRNCEVSLYLETMPDNSPKGLSIAKQLQVLMGKGLKIWKTIETPKWQIVIDRNSKVDNRAICSNEKKKISLSSTVVAKELLTTLSVGGSRDCYNTLSEMQKQLIVSDFLDPPKNNTVINLHTSPTGYITEEELFGEVFDKPCESLLINDPYLFNADKINALEPYLKMASKHNTLSKVTVHTKKSSDYKLQVDAENELNAKFNNLIKFKHIPLEHDRFIEISRLNGEKARIILGRGLDFIQEDGSIKSTFIVIQDPLIGSGSV